MRSVDAKSVRNLASMANRTTRRAAATALASRARRSAIARTERPGVTIVTVTWNTADHLEVQLEAVARRSPAASHIVVDNHSTDHTKEVLRGRQDIEVIRLPANVGHGPGLDIGMSHAVTEFIITLDIDAFPVAADWVETALAPLHAGATIAGAHAHRNFVHPCFLAVRRADFLRLGRSMRPVGRCPEPGQVSRDLFMDVGEAFSHIALLERGARALSWIPATSVHGPAPIGTVYGDAVYHNWFASQGAPDKRDQAEQAWRTAVARYVGDAP